MGYAVAEVVFARGARVTLISGPSELDCSPGINLLKVRTAQEMYKAVKKHFPKADALVMTAAVSDFALEKVFAGKIKKQKTELSLKLKPTSDILKEVGRDKGKKVLVGFAVETENEIENAKSKLKEKNLDLIIVNNPNLKGAGFEVDTNLATLIDKKGKVERLPLMSKKELAEKIIDRVVKLLNR
jgi:phosphopantothenoylcysteine decarboxylase/phosphopantothenate--cysteine ligase